jgi:hypothetical protein
MLYVSSKATRADDRYLSQALVGMRKRIVGINIHHSVFLDDALRGAANASAGLDSAIVRTGDNDLIELLWRLRGLTKELADARDRSRRRLRSLPADQVIRCREGEEPWPDELPEGFVPRCTCYDRCLVHDTGVGRDEDCNCAKVCPAHGRRAA